MLVDKRTLYLCNAFLGVKVTDRRAGVMFSYVGLDNVDEC